MVLITMKKKIFLLIVVAFVFLNLFAVSAEDNETVINDALRIDKTASPVVSIGTYVSDEMINVADSPNVGAIDPSLEPLEPHKFIVKSFNTTDLVKIYKNDSQFVVDARNTLCNSIHFFIYHDNLNKMENIISFGNCKVNESGYATVNIDLNPGVYYINVEQFVSTANQLYLYNYASTNKITVLSTLIGENLVKYYRNGSQFDIKLVDSSNKSVASQNVTFKVNGVLYSRQTNEEGIARLNINLVPGEYVLTATDPLTGLNMSYNITVLPTLIGDNLVKYYMNASQFEIKLVDSKGAPVASRNVRFNINGIFYSRQTDAEGIARLNINLSPGEYILTATDPLTGLNMSYNITVLHILYADDAMSHSSSCNYWVKLVDGKGNILTGKSITFNIDGLILNNVTDANGEAEIRLNLMPGQYIVTAQYLSAKLSNRILILG
jgi:hypothetical protein